MSRATYIVGDTLAVLPTLEPGSVDLVVTSPPFLALRSYLPADHPDKPLEHGSEATPAAFLANLLDVTELCGRALAPHGSLAVELGDTFSGSGGAGGDYLEGGWREDQQQFAGSAASMREPNAAHWRAKNARKDAWPPAKSLCGIPALYASCLAYGRNLLALPGQPEWREFQPWRVRNLIAWCRPNPPVGALGDKFRPATSYITVATRSATRWWDDIPTRKEPVTGDRVMRQTTPTFDPERNQRAAHGERLQANNPAGAPLLDWWEITPTGFTSRLGAHYATFPDAIAVPLVQAMCPRRICRTCGTPSRRLVKAERIAPADDSTRRKNHSAANPRSGFTSDVPEIGWEYSRETVGWSTCGCPGTEHTREDGYHEGDGWRPGLVLDPYAGTGTTLLVATGHGRDAIGVDLDARNAALAEERIGLFLTIEEPAA